MPKHNTKSQGLVRHSAIMVRRLALNIQEAVSPIEITRFLNTIVFMGIDPVTGSALSWKDRWQAFELMVAYGFGRPVSQIELIEKVLTVLDDTEQGRPLIPELKTLTLEQIREKRAKLQQLLSSMQQPQLPTSEG